MNDKDKHTYTFGSAGNSYFNGQDGTITRDDGKTIRFNIRNRNMLAVEVKDYSFGLRDSAPEDVKRMAAELPRQVYYGNDMAFDEWAYEVVARDHFWRDAEWLCTDDPEAPDWAKGVYSDGRSGGWCCIDGSQWLADQGFPAGTPDFMVKPSNGGYRAYVIRRWEHGKLMEEGTEIIAALDDAEEAEEYVERLNKQHGEKYGFEVDEDYAQTLVMRDEFARLAFDIHGCIDGAHEALEQYIREEYAELETKRNANIIRSSN